MYLYMSESDQLNHRWNTEKSNVWSTKSLRCSKFKVPKCFSKLASISRSKASKWNYGSAFLPIWQDGA